MLNQAPENVGTSTNDNLRPTMKFLKSLMVRCPVDALEEVGAREDVQVVVFYSWIKTIIKLKLCFQDYIALCFPFH